MFRNISISKPFYEMLYHTCANFLGIDYPYLKENKKIQSLLNQIKSSKYAKGLIYIPDLTSLELEILDSKTWNFSICSQNIVSLKVSIEREGYLCLLVALEI